MNVSSGDPKDHRVCAARVMSLGAQEEAWLRQLTKTKSGWSVHAQVIAQVCDILDDICDGSRHHANVRAESGRTLYAQIQAFRDVWQPVESVAAAVDYPEAKTVVDLDKYLQRIRAQFYDKPPGEWNDETKDAFDRNQRAVQRVINAYHSKATHALLDNEKKCSEELKGFYPGVVGIAAA